MNKTILTSDKVITVTTIVKEYDRVVQFDDILDSVNIEYDDWVGQEPWNECDGWEHNADRVRYDRDDDRRGARGYVAGRDPVHITVDADWGNYDYFRANGCSKQVARELTAQIKRDAIDQLVKWYSDGWEYYFVNGEYQGYFDSVGSIDSYEYAKECKIDVAGKIAAQMENDGYIVEGYHPPNKLDNWKACYDHKIKSFNMK